MPLTKPTSLRDKAAQLVFVRLGSNMPPSVTVAGDAGRIAALIERCPVGGLVLFNGSVEETPAMLAEIQAQRRFPLLVATDMERGVGQQIRGATVFPHAAAYCTEADVEASARIAAREALACGLHITFAPVADVNRDPRNPIIATRAFGADPEQAARMAAAYVHGCRAEGLLTTAKHFPGHGNTSRDSHAELPVVESTRGEWERTDAVPFRTAIDAGVELVMTGHLVYPALDASRTPATGSHAILHDVLRGELGFRGAVITDSLLMAAVRGGDAGKQAVALVRAGVDILLDLPDPEAAVAGLVRAVEAGQLSEARLDEAMGRVWALKERMAARFGADVFTHPPAAEVGAAAHRRQAEAVARRGLRVIKTGPEMSAPDLVILIQPHRSHLDPPEAPMGAMVRAKLPDTAYAEIGPDTDAAAMAEVSAQAMAARHVVVALVVKPAAWHAFGLLPAQDAFVADLVARRPVALAALGSPHILARFPVAEAHLCTYSDVAPSQRALVEWLAEGARPDSG